MSMVYNKSLLKSFGYSVEGVLHALKHNRNLRIAFTLGAIVLVLGWYLQVNSYEMVILVITVFMVIVAEMINTALEEMVNLITNEHRKEAKITKDVSAGMVLIASIGSIIVGAIIFAPYILK